MDDDQANQDQLVAQLMGEAILAMDRAGALDKWVALRFEGSLNDDALKLACTQVAQRFLTSDPPEVGHWEHLVVAIAFHSSRNRQSSSLDICKSTIQHLVDLLSDKRVFRFDTPKLVTLASAMTVVLAIQDKLTQEVETAFRRLCDAFPDALSEIAQHCQDIWIRRGQMSGRPGLFLWDVRRREWRLAQDFKPYQ